MGQFPEKLPLPEQVSKNRDIRKSEMIHQLFRVMTIRSLIIIAEILAFIFYNTSTLLLDAISMLADIGSSLFLVICIKYASKPPDRGHPFGHGRFEPLGGLQLALLLVVIGGGLFVQQVREVFAPSNMTFQSWIFLIPLFGALLLEISYRWLKKCAQKQNSTALHSEALHYRMDALTSLLASLSLGLTFVFPKVSHIIDHLGASAISALMVIVGARACKQNMDQLMDKIPDKKYFKLIRNAVAKVEGVFASEKLLIQFYGPDAHVSIDVEVDPRLSVEVSHRISQMVRVAIQEAWPQVRDVIVHIEPFYPGDHALKED